MTKNHEMPPIYRYLLYPNYWPTWLGLGIMWLITKLPYQKAMGVGRFLSKIARPLIKKRIHIARTNIALCMKDLSEKEQAALLEQHIESLGMGLIEMCLAWWAKDEKLCKIFKMEGTENLDKGFENGKGILLIGGHFTTLDLTGRMFQLAGYPLCINYRKSKNKVIDAMLTRTRLRFFERSIDRHNLRAFIKTLKENKILWYAPDQDYGRKYSTFAPFFGEEAASITATERFAKLSNATVMSCHYFRLPNDQGYKIVVNPPIDDYPSEDERVNATQINQLIEAAVLDAPEQYYWVHRRFKTRPEGLARPY